MKAWHGSRFDKLTMSGFFPFALILVLALACGPAAQPAQQPSADSGSSEPKRGGMVRFYLRGDPQGGFEPHIPGGRRDTRKVVGLAVQNVAQWDTLSGEQCTVALRGALAESWKFVDGTTVELSLRKGVKFQNKPPVNGRELTAEDVVWSYKRMFDKGILRSIQRNLASIEAPDKYTVRIKTREPEPLIGDAWLVFREAVVLPKEAGGTEDDFSRPENIIGTGPYILESYTPGVKAVLSRNPSYWKEGQPYIDQIDLPIMRDEATKLASFRTGQLDFLDELTVTERNQIVQGNPNAQFVPCESTPAGVVFPKNAEPPFNNVNVRRALSMSVDRDAIVKGIMKGEGNVVGVAPWFVEGSMKPQDFPAETRKYLQYNPSESKKMLADAGYPDGISFNIEATLGYGSPYNEIVEVLPAMMKPAGFNATLKILDLQNLQATLNHGIYDKVQINKGSTGSYPIERPTAGARSNESPDLNRAHVKDPELDRLIERMVRTVDDKQRMDIARQVQVRMVDQAYFLNMPTFMNFNAVQPYLRGFKINESTFREATWALFEGAWLDK